MILFAKNITNRLRYSCEFIGLELFNSPILVTDNVDEFKSYQGPRINYDFSPILDDEFRMHPHKLLFEESITAQTISCNEKKGIKFFFEIGDSDFPFDLFAAVFYLLSRYEEYLPHQKDEYGRFSHKSSLAFKEDFLHRPLINAWIEEFKIFLSRRFPTISFYNKAFRFYPTYDIDLAWKYKGKGIIRNLGGCLIAIRRGDWDSVKERIRVLTGQQKDPYDAYEWLDALHLYCRMKPYYFFLLAENLKGVDKNISPSDKQLQRLIAYHAKRGIVGIHPSWQSGDDKKLFNQEKGWLEFIAGHEVRQSRQHYLRFSLPETFRTLLKAGIKEDFSMGYGTINGFRASVASPFYWFDLEKNESSNLLLHPFCFMDANCYYEQGYSAIQAFSELMDLYYAVKKVNGTMITIWHNQFLGSEKIFRQWKNVYEIFLKDEVYWDV